MSDSVCCAIISSSLVGMTQTETGLSEVEIRGPPTTFAGSSSLTPSQASLAHSAARTRTECSPMPACSAWPASSRNVRGELAVLETLDNGKPIKEYRATSTCLSAAAHFFSYTRAGPSKLAYAGFGPTRGRSAWPGRSYRGTSRC